MVAITIFGIGSLKQKAIEKRLTVVANELGFQVELNLVEDVDQFMVQGITEIPCIMLDNKVIFKGKPPSIEELKKVLKDHPTVLKH
ncbi:MAG: thioredoxin family protein [Bacteroidota bacterium]